jgi:hypothetical protein
MKLLRHKLGESAPAFKGNFTKPQVRRLWLAGAGSVIGLWAYSMALAVVLRLLVPVGSEQAADCHAERSTPLER